MPVRHYCFLSFGPWGNNPGHIRPRELGAEMLRRGIRVTYVVDDYPANRAGLPVAKGADVVFVPRPRGAGQLLARRKILRDLAPDFVHVKDVLGRTLLALSTQPKLKVVLDWDEPNVLKPQPWAQLQRERFLSRRVVRRADRTVVTTRRLQRYVKDHYGVNAAYLPYATYLRPPPDDGPSPFAEPTFVYMGSMLPMWDIDLMMDALRLLGESGCKPPVTFVGTGPDSEWAAFARQHGLTNLRFVGYQPDEAMWRFVRHAHALLFPIRPTIVNETRCPSKTIVYAQARRPVITMRVGEVAEMLGDAATYVDPTPQAIAAAIRAAYERPALPDVDYHLEERYNYRRRVDELLTFLDP